MANTPAVIPLQIAPPIVDVSLTPFVVASGTVGNAYTAGSLKSTGDNQPANNAWAATNGSTTYVAGVAVTDPSAGAMFATACTAGTYNGITAPYGIAGRVLVPLAGQKQSPTPVNLQMLRMEVLGLWWETTPTGTMCGRDSGLVFSAGGGAAGGAVLDFGQVGNGGQNKGFGAVVNPATGKLQWVAKNVLNTGNALSEQVDIAAPANGLNRPFNLEIRITFATATTAATVQTFIDGVVSLTRTWAAGTLLPLPPAPGSNTNFGLMPVIGNNTVLTGTVNPIMHFNAARLRIGSTLACLLENQS